MSLSDKEIYHSARAVMAQYGEGAMTHARERLAALRAAEDDLGVAAWSRIAAAIEALQNQEPDLTH